MPCFSECFPSFMLAVFSDGSVIFSCLCSLFPVVHVRHLLRWLRSPGLSSYMEEWGLTSDWQWGACGRGWVDTEGVTGQRPWEASSGGAAWLASSSWVVRFYGENPPVSWLEGEGLAGFLLESERQRMGPWLTWYARVHGSVCVLPAVALFLSWARIARSETFLLFSQRVTSPCLFLGGVGDRGGVYY